MAEQPSSIRQVREIVADLLACAGEVEAGDSLRLLGADDLDRVLIATELEDVFGVAISDEAQAGWSTVRSVAESVDTALAGERARRTTGTVEYRSAIEAAGQTSMFGDGRTG